MGDLLRELASLRTDLAALRRRVEIATLIVAINLAATFTALGVALAR